MSELINNDEHRDVSSDKQDSESKAFYLLLFKEQRTVTLS
jgi:hypothetical protein